MTKPMAHKPKPYTTSCTAAILFLVAFTAFVAYFVVGL